MASTSDLADYSVCQSASVILENTHFQSRTTIEDHKIEFVSFDDNVKFRVTLYPSGFNLFETQTDPGYVYISLSSNSNPAKSLVQLAVSLIDFQGEKQFTQNFGKKSSQLADKKRIQARFCPRSTILDSSLTYLHNGTLKVLFEITLLKKVANTSLKPRKTGITSLRSDYASLLETGDFSDLTLLVGKKEFRVHKLILSARSPVFARMFNGDFKESKDNRVELEDIREEVLPELLSFIYTELLTNLEAHAFGLLAAAEKYQIEALKAICGQYLCGTLNTDTLLSLLQMATLYNVPELKSKCLTFFAKHSKEIKLSQEWEQLIITEGNQELLGLLLQSVMLTE